MAEISSRLPSLSRSRQVHQLEKIPVGTIAVGDADEVQRVGSRKIETDIERVSAPFLQYSACIEI
jgi:hypothetical protein